MHVEHLVASLYKPKAIYSLVGVNESPNGFCCCCCCVLWRSVIGEAKRAEKNKRELAGLQRSLVLGGGHVPVAKPNAKLLLLLLLQLLGTVLTCKPGATLSHAAIKTCSNGEPRPAKPHSKQHPPETIQSPNRNTMTTVS